MNPRRSGIARVVLLWLVLLAASPITAPFSSFDLGDLSPGSPFHGTTVKSKGSDQQQFCVGTLAPVASDVVECQELLAVRGGVDLRARVPVIVPLRI